MKQQASKNAAVGMAQTSVIRSFLADSIASNILFLKLEHEVLLKVVEGFEMEECPSDKDIIVQGDKGEFFYVIQHGECNVLIDDNFGSSSNAAYSQSEQGGASNEILGYDHVTGEAVYAGGSGEATGETASSSTVRGVIHQGGTFGELALMYNTPRQATIRSTVASTLWKLSRQMFHLIVAVHEREKKQRHMDYLRGVPMLAKLSSSQLNGLASVVGTETLAREDSVYLMDEKTTMLYIVASGKVELRRMRRGKTGSLHVVGGGEENKETTMTTAAVAVVESSNDEIADKMLTSGDYFGMQAVLSTATGAEYYSKMSAFATEPRTELITLTAEDLIRIAGGKWLIEYEMNNNSVNSGSKVRGEGGGSGSSGSSSGASVSSAFPVSPASSTSLASSSASTNDGSEKNSKMSSRVGCVDGDEDENESRDTVSHLPESLPQMKRNSANELIPPPTNGRGRSRTISEQSVVVLPSDWRDASIPTLKALELMQIIGKGSFGEVLLARVKSVAMANGSEAGPERLVAVKKLKKADLASSGCTPHVMNERKALAMARGTPFIIEMYNTFVDSRYLYFVLELCRGGDLFGLLCKCERLVEKDARFYTASVLNAFAYMHERGVIYRDLKPENLLITENGYLKVADLGLAKAIPDGVTYTMCGTPVYMAPEMLLSSGHGAPADAWAIGIMIYELCGGYPPFEGEDQMSTYELIINASITWPTPDLSGGDDVGSHKREGEGGGEDGDGERLAELWGSSGEIVKTYKFGSSLKDLITNLLIKEPGRRAGGGNASQKPFEAVMKSRWFSGFDWQAFYKQRMTPPVVPHVGDWLENFEEYEEEDEPIEYQGNDFDDFDK